jgi:DNA-binding winged helix-turn-helix (wHTH) protein/tetratricopeptide (TPR) repeat protein
MKLLFESFSLDPELRELRKGDQSISLAPKVFDLLCFLATHRDTLITRDMMIAEVWDGRIVSDSTLASHVNAVRKAVGDNGTDQRVIRTVSRKGFRFLSEVKSYAGSILRPSAGTAYPVSINEPLDLPRICISAFIALTSRREDANFADGLREELLNKLARMPEFEISAESNVFNQVSSPWTPLSPDYVLEANVRSSGGVRRISARLSDRGGVCFWADQIDVVAHDELQSQEAVAARVSSAISDGLRKSEILRVLRKPVETFTAYDFYVLGQSLMERRGRCHLDRAKRAFDKAIQLNPDYGAAYGAAAWSLVMKKQALWMEDVERESAEGARLADLAITHGSDDAVALARGSYALGHFGEDLEVCSAYMEKALRVGPGSALAWTLGGGQLLSAGRPREALGRIAHAAKSHPTETQKSDIAILTSLAHLLTLKSDAAATAARAAFSLDPSNPRAIAMNAASHFTGGRTREAARAMHLLRRRNPTLRVAGVRNWVHLRRRGDLDIFTEGLKGAGLPA